MQPPFQVPEERCIVIVRHRNRTINVILYAMNDM